MARPLVELQNLTKSFNEAVILASLAEGPKHGYQLVLVLSERSEGMIEFNHGTLYPILHKLEKQGLIKGTWSEKPNERKRKSYTLLPKGRRYARDQREAWRLFVRRFFAVVGMEES